MIEIQKSKTPRKLEEYRRKKGASYPDMDKPVREEVVDSLLKEQGHLCAYCMRRIPEGRKLPIGVSSVTIEHWIPQNPESKEDVGQGLD